jgi:mannonate dehydratase
VESIPIHKCIKLRSGPYQRFVGAWKDSLVAVAKAGVKVVCYNFMPVVDWIRTDLKWPLPSTGFALRFDTCDFAAYDLFILQRENAESDYPAERVADALARYEAMPQSRREDLQQTIIAGLPGAEGSYDREGIRRSLAEYEGLTAADLRANLAAFLDEVAPVAEQVGVRLAIHPDDPPLSLFGLPRVVSTEADAEAILASYDTAANGLTFCVGSYGARRDNDLMGMVRKFAHRIHFAHLRQVTREADGSFYEAEHLNGSSDMVGIIRELMKEEARRRAEGRADHEIPMRPDHGHLLADDGDKKVNPGYTLVGRLKGLAELRGVMHGLQYAIPKLSS